MSEESFRFAVRLAKEFPDKYVATMAYSLREIPPQGVMRLTKRRSEVAPFVTLMEGTLRIEPESARGSQ